MTDPNQKKDVNENDNENQNQNDSVEEAAEETLDATGSQTGSEVQELKDKHLRLAAEFDNYRKRVMRDHAENVARAQTGLLAKLVDVLDDLDRVAHHSENATKETLLQGVELTERKFRTILESAGLERIETEGAFDPATMEALTTVPTDNADEDDHVSDVFQPGYRFQGTLLRPARVVVKKFGAA